MKFFKISGLWFTAILITILLIVWSSYFDLDTFAKIIMSTLYGYFLMLFIGAALKIVNPMPIRQSVWWAGVLNVIACIISDSDFIFFIGSTLGIVLCYQLLKLSKRLASSEPHVA